MDDVPDGAGEGEGEGVCPLSFRIIPLGPNLFEILVLTVTYNPIRFWPRKYKDKK